MVWQTWPQTYQIMLWVNNDTLIWKNFGAKFVFAHDVQKKIEWSECILRVMSCGNSSNNALSYQKNNNKHRKKIHLWNFWA